MVKRRISPASGDSDYTVGYGRPPVHSRFQSGQSGNPAGRRKGVRNLMTDVKRTLLKPVTLKEGGRTQKRTTQESLLLVLREKALRGDARALDCLLDLAQRFNNDSADAAAAQPLSADDQAILDAFAAESAAATKTAATSTPPDDRVTIPGRQSRKKRAR
jgi:hypothetical protein